MMKKLKKTTSEEGLYNGVFYRSEYGAYRIFGEAFDFRWESIPRERENDRTAVMLMTRALNYGIRYSYVVNDAPNLVRGFCLEGIDCTTVRIDDQMDEML